MTVRVRFAPSPTGYLHIGGVRTALFNWLFARRHGGRFILRIDDTDAQRNVQEALQPILDGFRWLGIDWDEGPDAGGDHGPYYQSQKLARYQEAARALLDGGHAYWDYARPEELEAERKAAQGSFTYSRRWMATTPEERAAFEREGRTGAVRLKMPREGACRFHDLVRGDVSFDWAREQDHVVQRADGTCLYHLASVVDDRDMAITHVIRAEEHLSNTPRQIFIAQALGAPLPQFAHLPFVAEPGSKQKLSKRKLDVYLKNHAFARMVNHGRGITGDADLNPVMVEFYSRVGYLPHAVVNYLLLLGWSLDDKTEFFTREEMIANFSLERVGKGSASFDPDKLSAFQDHYMQALDVEKKVTLAAPFLAAAGLQADPARLRAVLRAAADRLKVAGDILNYRAFFEADDVFTYDQKAFEKRIAKAEGAKDLLSGFRDRLGGADPFVAASLERLLQEYIASRGVQLGQVIHAVRVAVTGQPVGFGLYECLEILGKPHCQARINRALNHS